ncbi:DedA family protein [Nesterenkonia sp. E16_7]|uniref:DedA family protein n=1 Tax=unclassified Nesterenkonia TaxID=2629769 RepID=UPI001A933FE8|nr:MULTISPECIES: DedA family protein [unclassified Nesterenkonia]MBO0594771.1 DedA family protein [Nesterenkonia sp. E16_10]MBO0597479.1 DedA family protein [Nesterenkonia sp. E16_7]
MGFNLEATGLTPAPGASEYQGFIGWVLSLMERFGEPGVGLAIFLENFIPPIPSEAILPGAGFLAYAGLMSPWGAWIWANLGSLLGAVLWYAVGSALGADRTRGIMGGLPLLKVQDFDKAERWFHQWGPWTVLLGRCVPIVRSFISIPAGITRMRWPTFLLFTLIGSAIWNGIWIGLGFALGPSIAPVLAEWSGVLSTLVVVLAGLAVVVFVVQRLWGVLRRTS